MTKKQIREGKDPAVAWAEKLWTKLHQNFLSTEKTIIDIVSAKAWEPLGYESFAKAWVERMADVRIAAAVQPHVVYQLIAEGLDDDQVADTVAGVGPATVEALRRQRDHGVPAGKTVKKSKRSKRLPIETWFIAMPLRESRELKRKAQRAGIRYADLAREGIREKFAGMD